MIAVLIVVSQVLADHIEQVVMVLSPLVRPGEKLVSCTTSKIFCQLIGTGGRTETADLKRHII